MKDNNINDLICKIFNEEDKFLNYGIWCENFHSLIKGLLSGLSNNSSYSDMEIFPSTISELIFLLDPSKPMIAFREIVSKFIEQYENGDKCDLYYISII